MSVFFKLFLAGYTLTIALFSYSEPLMDFEKLTGRLAQSSNTAAHPTQRPRELYLKGHNIINTKLLERNVDLIFLEDSITRGWATCLDLWQKFSKNGTPLLYLNKKGYEIWGNAMMPILEKKVMVN